MLSFLWFIKFTFSAFRQLYRRITQILALFLSIN